MSRQTKVLLVYNSKHGLHNGKMNECAARVDAVIEELKDTGLWEQCERFDAAANEKNPLSVVDQLLSNKATQKLFNRLREEYNCVKQWNCQQCTFANDLAEQQCLVCHAPRGGKQSFVIPAGKSDVYLCEQSANICIQNIAACIHSAHKVLDRGFSSAFCLLRPPGHHSSSESFGSYCLVNAASQVAQNLPNKKVVIVDWDVHHGNGTQNDLEKDAALQERCRFISIHRHDEHFWPKSGTVSEGGPSIINVPLTGTGYGDADYLYIFKTIVLPVCRQFAPDLILVSAGYDCALGDALGRFAVTPDGFADMTCSLLETTIPCLFVLEGGYHVEETSKAHKHLR